LLKLFEIIDWMHVWRKYVSFFTFGCGERSVTQMRKIYHKCFDVFHV